MATVTLALALLFGASQTSLDQREREAIDRARNAVMPGFRARTAKCRVLIV